MEHNQGTLMSRLYKFTLCNLFQKAVTKLEKTNIYFRKQWTARHQRWRFAPIIIGEFGFTSAGSKNVFAKLLRKKYCN